MSLTIDIKTTFDVELVEAAGSDEMICRAARVSTLGDAAIDSNASVGLLNFLMKNRHGSPFEHGFMTFRISAPIFVWREFMRHRIGFSYNEESGRYKELAGTFYMPSFNRNLVQKGKPGAYEFYQGTEQQYHDLTSSLYKSYQIAWESYQESLDAGIAKEVARMCLPVATYSSAFVSCNPRSLMNFLSLRTKSGISTYPSYPQWEINQVANDMEEYFAQLYPGTYSVFNEAGRVAP